MVEWGLMKVPCVDIARFIEDDLAKQVLELKKNQVHPRLVDVLIGESAEQLAFVKAKQKIAKELGVEFELVHLPVQPSFLTFANLLKDKSHDPNNHGVIIEQPVPSSLQSDTIFNFIPLSKELEGHRKKTQFLPPIGLTVLTILKYIYQNTNITDKLYPDPTRDPGFFKQSLKQKKVVLIGRGPTAGAPIANVLSNFRVNFINASSQTFEPEQYYRDADIIVTAVGKRILKAGDIKPGATLINVGINEERKEMAGDYDENEIKNIAGFYTSALKGTGPIDILYLFKNLIDAAKLQYA